MSEIKAEPFVPDEDYDNPAMVTDFYEFTMANCLYLHGFKDKVMVFDMFFRTNPDNQGYSISCGQHQLVKFLREYHFTDKDLIYLKTKGMSNEFLEYLRTYKWKGDMYALKEGTVCYPQVPMVRIECDMVGAILIETYLLQTMNFHSLIATKATKISGLSTHTPRNVMEFGTRRAQGESAGNEGAYAAILGGCIGTADCLAEMKYGPDVKAVGTSAHSFIEFYGDEFEAFKAYAETYPDNVSLLLDTYNILESGLPNLISIDDWLKEKYPDDPNRRVKSARIDSGDLARNYKKLRKRLDEAGKPYVKLVASNSLDEKKMADMEVYENAHFDSYGVGEKLITSSSSPVFGGVYKLVAVKEDDGSYTPRMKCSDSASKAVIPGKLMAWRIYDENGQGQADIIGLDDEEIVEGKEIRVYDMDPDAFHKSRKITPLKVEKLLVPHIINGELAMELPTIPEKKAYIKDQLENKVWESELRPEVPHRHYVDLTEKLYNIREEMYEKLHGGNL
ncbi:MAG: nicotinate phosphoribosyltransferase [Erysipelotrichaceae bacterium]|nr:nicotinate phosphoribosyltransferase [Erysipelotrichaceae bacterium]